MDKKKIGQRIKQIRIDLGKNMDEFGKLFFPNVTKGTISKWENGKYLPNNSRLSRIASLGNVSLEYLLEGDDASLREIQKYLTSLQLENINLSSLTDEEIAYLISSKITKNYELANESMSDIYDILQNDKLSNINKQISETNFATHQLELIEAILETCKITKDDLGLSMSIYSYIEFMNTLISNSESITQEDSNYLLELSTNIVLAAQLKK